MGLHGQILNLHDDSDPRDSGGQFGYGYKNGHKSARHAAAELALKADAVIDAARAVLAFRHDTPTTGYLRDNDASREALRKLAAAVAAVGAA
jgi:hypothetical protein